MVPDRGGWREGRQAIILLLAAWRIRIVTAALSLAVLSLAAMLLALMLLD